MLLRIVPLLSRYFALFLLLSIFNYCVTRIRELSASFPAILFRLDKKHIRKDCKYVSNRMQSDLTLVLYFGHREYDQLYFGIAGM